MASSYESQSLPPLLSMLFHKLPSNRPRSMNEALIIGLYGVSGCGKSHMLRQLSDLHPEWLCVEGSEVIERVLQKEYGKHTTFSSFSRLDAKDKERIREKAIEWIRSASPAGVTVVAGHCSFPKVGSDDITFIDVFSQGDARTYNVIVYMQTDAGTVLSQRANDASSGKRDRTIMSKQQLQTWMDHEKDYLTQMSTNYGIEVTILHEDTDCDRVNEILCKNHVASLVEKAEKESETYLKEDVQKIPEGDTFLLIDGDRTLWPGDTGKLYFGEDAGKKKRIFERYSHYAFTAFWESAMLFMRSTDYHDRSSSLIHSMTLFETWINLLSNLPSNVQPVLVTSGVREIWKGALEQNGLGNVSITAGNRLETHLYIVDIKAKKTVAMTLREKYPGCLNFCVIPANEQR